MGVLENYKNEIVDITNNYVSEYERLELNAKTANDKMNKCPKQINGLNMNHKAEILRARADAEEAQEAYHRYISKSGAVFSDSINDVRQKALEYIESKFAADPSKIDNAMLELI